MVERAQGPRGRVRRAGNSTVGHPFVDFARDPWAAVEASRLVELRLAAIAERAERMLSLGRFEDVGRRPGTGRRGRADQRAAGRAVDDWVDQRRAAVRRGGGLFADAARVGRGVGP